MDSSLVLLGLLILLVLVSLGLDSYRCTLLSKSGLALLVGGIAGVVLAALHTDATAPFQLHHSIFFDVLLPPIIYEAGFSVERTTFFRNFGAVLATAIWGTLISACATGLTLYFASSCGWIPSIDWVEAFLFGALLSAVDPVATLAVFQKLNVPPVLFNVVFGESVLNDAVAIALYKALSLTTSGMTFPVLALVVCQTFGILVGSICVSMLVTLLGSAIFVHIPALRAYPAYEILLCVCVSWTTYFAAECCAFSGIVALFFSGILTSHYHYHVMSPVSQLVVHHTLETASFVSETLVYVFVGVATALVLCSNTVTSLPLSNHHHPSDSEGGGISWSFLGWTTLSLFVGRALNVFPLLSVTNYLRCNQDTLTVPMMVVMWLTGLRGAVAVALVTDWSYVQHQDDVIIDHKQLMVTTTLFLVIGTTWVALHAELKAFVDILDDYQKENDRIRDAVLSRPALPEPPSRMLLLDQLKLLASNLHERQLATPQDRALLGYVLSATPDSDVQNNGGNLTPRLKDCASFSSFNGNGVILRPGTADGSRRRSGTSSRPPSSRGLSSRGSVSSTASAPAMLEDLGCVSIRQIDSMKARLREALLDEKQQLLDDIEFIQGCVDMEQDLIEEDTKKVNVLVPPLKDLQEFRRTLEQVCLDKVAVRVYQSMLNTDHEAPMQDKYDHVQERITKAEEMVAAQQRRKRLHMFASPESLDLGQDLVVSWTNVHSHPADYLTLSCGPTVDKDDYIERIIVTTSSSSVRFEDLHMLRCVYVVSYYHFLNASFVLLGQVNVPMRMSIDSPQHGHLAFNDHIDQMVIMYNSASNRTIPSVKYSRRDPSGSTNVFVRSGTSSTYSASDIPDATVKWIAYGDMGVDSSPAAASTALHVSQDILRGYNSFLLHFGDIR
ncbi:hypothetical protein B5M09_002780 [Aphanomyces astaci]|uniref:Cation/H+ exchanger transmembrane domain-containing protein n=1 Tax=Aphanomyces astaci TaxID=112090 RepID=A0A425D657_APHAT|nr:hypothetical protein B5M09_002780 [Aphanomyces astaci]